MNFRHVHDSLVIATAAMVALTMYADPAESSPNQDEVANAIAKAAGYIYFSSFEQDPVTYAFDENELEILSNHLEPLDLLIRDALGVRDSVGGAMLMAHFGLAANMDFLRSHILKPGRYYGWEGSYDDDDEEKYFSDHQYVYHSKYVKAYEAVAGAPLYEVIKLSSSESEKIRQLAATPNKEHYHWANWIGRKMGIL